MCHGHNRSPAHGRVKNTEEFATEEHGNSQKKIGPLADVTNVPRELFRRF